MNASLMNPGFIILGIALVVAFTPFGWLRRALAVAAPFVAFALTMRAESQVLSTFDAFGLTLLPMRLNELHFALGLALIVALAAIQVFAFDEDDPFESAAILAAGGGAIAAAFAGDLVTFYVAGEIAAFSLLAALGAERAAAVGTQVRPILLVNLLAGALIGVGASLRSGAGEAWLAPTATLDLAGWSMALGLGLRAFSPLAAWWILPALHKAQTPLMLALCAFGPASALIGFAWMFRGIDAFVALGLIGALVPAPFALRETDPRRILGWGAMSHTGVAIAALALNGPQGMSSAIVYALSASIALCLLGLGIGAALTQVESAGRTQIPRALYRMMPVAALFTALGSIACMGLPPFGTFLARATVFDAFAKANMPLAELALIAIAATQVCYLGIRAPMLVFFSPAREIEPERLAVASSKLAVGAAEERPVEDANMAMLAGIGVALAFALYPGLSPSWFTAMVPDTNAALQYSLPMILQAFQVTAFALLGMAVFARWLPSDAIRRHNLVAMSEQVFSRTFLLASVWEASVRLANSLWLRILKGFNLVESFLSRGRHWEPVGLGLVAATILGLGALALGR